MAKRGPTRTPQERIEDAFMDLHPQQQIRMLATLATLHRMTMRLADKQMVSVANEDSQRSLIERRKCTAKFTPQFDDHSKCTYCDGSYEEHIAAGGHPQGSLIDEPAAETGTKLKKSVSLPIE